MEDGFRILIDTPKHILVEKTNKEMRWFNNDCSDKNLKKKLNRPNDTINRIKFGDGYYIGSELNIYFN